MIGLFIEAMERGILPDAAIRAGIRKLCSDRLASLQHSPERSQEDLNRYIQNLREGPIAVHTQDANKQHYELPAGFFEKALGKNLKYSSTYWPEGCESLDESEELALAATCSRAQLEDGMNILELGCGWGSLTLHMARKFPKAKIVALSNSASQREFIQGKAKERGLNNIEIITRNVAEVVNLQSEYPLFDRVVSVEMFEHMKNYEMLLNRISTWLKPEGKLFVHIFTHKQYSYPFDVEGEDNWMGKYFFTGGQMPGHDLLLHFQKDLVLENQWAWNGTHYGKTSNAWLENMDQHRTEIMPVFEKTYGKDDAERWFQRWRVFFMSCAELFHYKEGSEWGVSHYLFQNRSQK